MLRIVNKRKRIIAQMLHRVGYPLFKAFSLLVPDKEPPKDIRSILAMRLAYIGDVVLNIPAIKALRNTFPNAKISFLTSPKAKEAIENNPYVDEIITYDAPWFYPQKPWSSFVNYMNLIKLIRSKHFDMVIDFRGDFRNILLVVFSSGASRRVGYGMTGGGYLLTDAVECTENKHKVEFHLDIVRALGGDSAIPDTINLYPTPEDRDRVLKLLSEKEIKQNDMLVGIHPGGRAKLKCWDIKSYVEVADALVKRYNAKIVITGGPDEVKLGEKLLSLMKSKGFNLCGLLSLKQLQILLERLNLVITNDTVTLHVASGVNTPTVAIFGPSEVWDTGPLSQKHKVIMRDLDCRTFCDTYSCNNRNYHECLRSIKPAEVIEASVELLEGSKLTNKDFKVCESKKRVLCF